MEKGSAQNFKVYSLVEFKNEKEESVRKGGKFTVLITKYGIKCRSHIFDMVRDGL